MKKIFAALLLTATAAMAQDAAKPAPNYVVIHMERNIDRPAALLWSRVGGYCQIEAWFGTKCVYSSGSGDIGTNRQLNGTINELMVGKTPLSYAYSQPTSPIYYHGNLSVEVVDSGHSKIVYDLLYDGSGMTPEARADDMAKRKTRFEAGIDKMVEIAHQ